MSQLSRALGIEWPPNVLRHSFISYRIAIVQSADQVTLEAGNSASIIFKHYRELTTPEVAEKYLGCRISVLFGVRYLGCRISTF